MGEKRGRMAEGLLWTTNPLVCWKDRRQLCSVGTGPAGASYHLSLALSTPTPHLFQGPHSRQQTQHSELVLLTCLGQTGLERQWVS